MEYNIVAITSLKIKGAVFQIIVLHPIEPLLQLALLVQSGSCYGEKLASVENIKNYSVAPYCEDFFLVFCERKKKDIPDLGASSSPVRFITKALSSYKCLMKHLQMIVL